MTTEFKIMKNRQEVGRIVASREYAESIAFQVGGVISPVPPPEKETPKQRKGRQERLLTKLTKEER